MTAVLLALALTAPSSFVALDEVDPTILQDIHFTLRDERHPDRYFDFPVVWPPTPGS